MCVSLHIPDRCRCIHACRSGSRAATLPQGRRRRPFLLDASRGRPLACPIPWHVRQGDTGGNWGRAVQLAVPPARWRHLRALRAVGEWVPHGLGGWVLKLLSERPPAGCVFCAGEFVLPSTDSCLNAALQWRWTTGNSCTVPGSPAWLATGNLPTCGSWGAYPEGEPPHCVAALCGSFVWHYLVAACMCAAVAGACRVRLFRMQQLAAVWVHRGCWLWLPKWQHAVGA